MPSSQLWPITCVHTHAHTPHSSSPVAALSYPQGALEQRTLHLQKKMNVETQLLHRECLPLAPWLPGCKQSCVLQPSKNGSSESSQEFHQDIFCIATSPENINPTTSLPGLKHFSNSATTELIKSSPLDLGWTVLLDLWTTSPHLPAF